MYPEGGNYKRHPQNNQGDDLRSRGHAPPVANVRDVGTQVLVTHELVVKPFRPSHVASRCQQQKRCRGEQRQNRTEYTEEQEESPKDI